MEKEKVIQQTKRILLTLAGVGAVLLAAGILAGLTGVPKVPNDRALVGLSFIPLSGALVYYLKLRRLKGPAGKSRALLVTETDERLVTLNHEADAKAFRITQAALFLAYLGYTFMVPADIFEAPGWWLLCIILFVSFIAQAVLHFQMERNNHLNEEE